MPRKISLILSLFILVLSCSTSNRSFSDIDIQGHRGCRGLMPENTIPGFLRALDLGVNTLELDLAITGDSQVIVSHEPYFNHEISTDSLGNPITEDIQYAHNIYQMSYEQVSKYDVGLKDHPRFPEQQKMAVKKPLLSEVIAAADHHSEMNNRPLPDYNIEIKSKPEGDTRYHPTVDRFSELVYDVVDQKLDWSRVTIQSFDFRVLQYFKEKYPKVRLALLIENELDWKTNIDSLGFIPDIYSCDYGLLNEENIPELQQAGMKVIPWTVNERSHMDRLLQLGVDGLITDYPDRIK